MVEGDASTYYYLDGALGCECGESQPIRDDMLSDFYPEAWELSPKDMESMFNDFYFDNTVDDSLNLMALQASTEQLDIVTTPLTDGSVIESKTDLDTNPYWTTYFNVVRAEESWTEIELKEVGLLKPELIMAADETRHSTPMACGIMVVKSIQ